MPWPTWDQQRQLHHPERREPDLYVDGIRIQYLRHRDHRVEQHVHGGRIVANFLNSGTLQGIGTLHGNVDNTGILMAGLPGASGTLTITGNYSDPMGSQIFVTIDTHGASLLYINGTASLTGTSLDINLVGSFTPNSHYEILDATGGITAR